MASSGHCESTLSGELYNLRYCIFIKHDLFIDLLCLSLDSVEEDACIAWFSLIQNLSRGKLELLKAHFDEKQDLGLDREEFLNVICSLYGIFPMLCLKNVY